MSAVRLNITIPEELARQLDKLVGPRNKSHFIAEALKQRIGEIQEEELNKILEEGYKARKQESLSIAKEFEAVDVEGWDEY
jgi:metal-responsive CopG/Arc/MetJ family transcriptional regulator